jgi:hypothetical protein
MNLRFFLTSALLALPTLAALAACAVPFESAASDLVETIDAEHYGPESAGGRDHDVKLTVTRNSQRLLGAIRYDVFGDAWRSQCKGTPEEVVESTGFPLMTLSFHHADVDEQAALDGSICLQEAIRRGLDSLLTDASDEESPLALLVDLLGDESAARSALENLLNRPNTRLALVPLVWSRQPGVYPPEMGESVEENWALFVTIDDLSDHFFWVIVPREGGAVTNYGFN